ncbi:MAG: hypothetical protein KBC38_01135 [Candidatus Pacebacteria bacterium]|nr:hypothetical protein [Candidatus Paceibacterota bacterium]MBP9840238.1 hypothetical protein [Candidatus Paceibacterota bacterium]
MAKEIFDIKEKVGIDVSGEYEKIKVANRILRRSTVVNMIHTVGLFLIFVLALLTLFSTY